MADWIDPTAVMATNPYLSLQSAQPDKWSVLGNLLVGAGAGISQAEAAGHGWATGIAPGLMAGLRMTNALQKQAEDQSLRRAQYAMMLGGGSALAREIARRHSQQEDRRRSQPSTYGFGDPNRQWR